MDALEHVRAVASEFSATELEQQPGKSRYELALRLPSSETVVYSLEVINYASGKVTVKERPRKRLPACCPERHINAGGTFCLNWEAGDPLEIVDGQSARSWWSLLTAFLRRQEAVARIRKWIGPSYAHGEAAAFQREAERAAANLGKEFESLLDEGQLQLRRDQRHGKDRIELLRNLEVVARLNPSTKELTNASMACVCALGRSGSSISDCGTHANDLKTLITSLGKWRKFEAQFIEDLKRRGTKCCGTLDSCPLRSR